MCADFWQLMHRGAPRLVLRRTLPALTRYRRVPVSVRSSGGRRRSKAVPAKSTAVVQHGGRVVEEYQGGRRDSCELQHRPAACQRHDREGLRPMTRPWQCLADVACPEGPERPAAAGHGVATNSRPRWAGLAPMIISYRPGVCGLLQYAQGLDGKQSEQSLASQGCNKPTVEHAPRPCLV